MKSHGEVTVNLAKMIFQDWEDRGYKVLYDHGISRKNVGKIVSTLKKDYGREDELSQMDIAIVEQNSDKVAVLVEIEETSDRPKTLLGDIFGVLCGENIFFKRKELLVGDYTTLIVVGVNKINHKRRNLLILELVNSVKKSLGPKNARIGKVEIKTFTDETKLVAQLPSMLDRAFKGEL